MQLMPSMKKKKTKKMVFKTEKDPRFRPPLKQNLLNKKKRVAK